MMSAVDEAFYN